MYKMWIGNLGLGETFGTTFNSLYWTLTEIEEKLLSFDTLDEGLHHQDDVIINQNLGGLVSTQW